MYRFDDMYRVLTMMCTSKASGSQMADSWFPTAVILHFYSAV